MGNLLNAFVNSGAINGVNPAGAMSNALTIQGQGQTNQLNALKLKNYDVDQETQRKAQEFQNVASAVNVAMKMPTEEEANAWLEKVLSGKGVRVAFDKPNKTASWSGPQGTLTGPADLMGDWSEALAKNSYTPEELQTHVAHILRAGGSWTAAAGIGAKDQAQLDLEKEKMSATERQHQETLKNQKDIAAMNNATKETVAGGGAGMAPMSGHGDASLEGLSEGDKSIVKQIAEYKMALPSGFSLSKPYWQNIMRHVAQYNPDFDATQYNVRMGVRRDFTTGASSKNINSLNTAVGHIDSLVKAKDALNNSNWSSVNAMENILSKHLPVTQGLVERQGQVTSARTKFNAVTSEMATIFKNTGATDQEISAWKGTIDDPASATPQQWKAFIEGALELMGSRIKSLNNKYEEGMGKPKDYNFLSKESRTILGNLGLDTSQLDPVIDNATTTTGGKKPLSEY
jgi:hypothetical protein